MKPLTAFLAVTGSVVFAALGVACSSGSDDPFPGIEAEMDASAAANPPPPTSDASSTKETSVSVDASSSTDASSSVDAAPADVFVVKQTGGASYYDERSVIAFPKYRSDRGCAHKTLPAGTNVRMRYKGKYTSCVVDDRGPYISGRIIDLQSKQFAELAPLSAGVLNGVELSY